jgi:hypothetical protein
LLEVAFDIDARGVLPNVETAVKIADAMSK